MNATVETRHDDGSPETLRDENGFRWRVAADAADGTLAVEEIDDFGGGSAAPQIADYEAGRCAVARWEGGETLSLFMARDVGENHTDPKQYQAGDDLYVASTAGWKADGDGEGIDLAEDLSDRQALRARGLEPAE